VWGLLPDSVGVLVTRTSIVIDCSQSMFFRVTESVFFALVHFPPPIRYSVLTGAPLASPAVHEKVIERLDLSGSGFVLAVTAGLPGGPYGVTESGVEGSPQ